MSRVVSKVVGLVTDLVGDLDIRYTDRAQRGDQFDDRWRDTGDAKRHLNDDSFIGRHLYIICQHT